MQAEDIMFCVNTVSTLLPKLRDSLGLTQREFSSFLGISRQSLIDLEHQNRKITRPVLASIISYFSLREETAHILFEEKLYNNSYVNQLGFSLELIHHLYGFLEETDCE